MASESGEKGEFKLHFCYLNFEALVASTIAWLRSIPAHKVGVLYQFCTYEIKLKCMMVDDSW